MTTATQQHCWHISLSFCSHSMWEWINCNDGLKSRVSQLRFLIYLGFVYGLPEWISHDRGIKIEKFPLVSVKYFLLFFLQFLTDHLIFFFDSSQVGTWDSPTFTASPSMRLRQQQTDMRKSLFQASVPWVDDISFLFERVPFRKINTNLKHSHVPRSKLSTANEKKKIVFKTQKCNKLKRKKFFLRYNFMIHASHILLLRSSTSRDHDISLSREWLLVLPHFHLMNCHIALLVRWVMYAAAGVEVILLFINRSSRLVIVLLVCILIKKSSSFAVWKFDDRRLPRFCYCWDDWRGSHGEKISREVDEGSLNDWQSFVIHLTAVFLCRWLAIWSERFCGDNFHKFTFQPEIITIYWVAGASEWGNWN